MEQPTPILIAEKTRFQRLYRRIGLIRGFVMFNLMFLGLFTVLAFIGWGWGDSALLLKYVDQFSTWMTSGMTFWKWLVGVILNFAILIPIIYWVMEWNGKFDSTPDAIYFNGNNFERLIEGKKEDLYSLPSLKRGRFHVHEFWLSLSLKGRIDSYRLAEMIDSHKSWFDLEKTIRKYSRTS